jgi:hypothetical protein
VPRKLNRAGIDAEDWISYFLLSYSMKDKKLVEMAFFPTSKTIEEKIEELLLKYDPYG